MPEIDMDRLFSLEPEADCDHEGCEKKPGHNPEPEILAEVRYCARCGEISDHRLLYPPLPKGRLMTYSKGRRVV
jgi:hypothetical protein